jgi:hypothetical protein
MNEIIVSAINAKETKPWLLQRHYAKRMCPISFAFGAWSGSTLVGVVTYGVPVSSSLRAGVCGKEWSSKVIELNRLCCENTKNIASILVGRSLRMLPRPLIVVSYADTEQGHVGYVYQATNFVYTGLSAKRTDWKIKGKEHLHGATVADESRGQPNRAQWMRDKYGDDFYLQERPRKHRYIYACGSKSERKQILNALQYKVEPYPKGESKRYNISNEIETQSLLIIQ